MGSDSPVISLALAAMQASIPRLTVNPDQAASKIVRFSPSAHPKASRRPFAAYFCLATHKFRLRICELSIRRNAELSRSPVSSILGLAALGFVCALPTQAVDNINGTKQH